MEFLLDSHTHTIASGHAYSTLLENIQFGKENGMKMIAITDHAPDMQHTTNRVYFLNIVNAVPKKIMGVDVLRGVELNILDTDGKVDLEDDILKKLDIVIASLHMPRLKGESKESLTEACIRVMKNPHIDIMGHLGDPRYPLDYEKIMKSSVETGTIIEINNASLNESGFRKGSIDNIKIILQIAKRDDIEIVVSSDAHFATGIGGFSLAEKLLEEMDFPKHLILNSNPEKFVASLKRNRFKDNGV